MEMCNFSISVTSNQMSSWKVSIFNTQIVVSNIVAFVSNSKNERLDLPIPMTRRIKSCTKF